MAKYSPSALAAWQSFGMEPPADWYAPGEPGYTGGPAPASTAPLLTTGGNYSFDINHLQGGGDPYYAASAETSDNQAAGYDKFKKFTAADGTPLIAMPNGDGNWRVSRDIDTGGGYLGPQHMSKWNGQPYDIVTPSGSLVTKGVYEGLKDSKIGSGAGFLSVLAMPFAAAAAGLGAAGAAGAVGGAAEGVGGLAGAAGGAAGGTTAAELAAAELAGAGLGGGAGGAALGADAIAAYASMAGVTPEAMAAAMGMSPEAFASLGAAGTGAAGAAAGQLAGTAAGSAASGLGGLGSAAGSLLPGGWSSLITPALQLLGGAYTAHQAGNASDAIVDATNNGIAENRRQFDLVRGLLQPYVDAGTGALGAYQGLSGLKGADAQQSEINLLRNTPQFTSLAQQGEDAILQNASATGGLRGGNTQGGLANFRSNLLTSLIDKQLGRYGSLINVGQNSAAGTGNAAMTSGAANAALMQQQGAAQAGGIVAGTNAITNAVGGIGGFFAGQNAVTPPPANPYYIAPGAGAGVATYQPTRAF